MFLKPVWVKNAFRIYTIIASSNIFGIFVHILTAQSIRCVLYVRSLNSVLGDSGRWRHRLSAPRTLLCSGTTPLAGGGCCQLLVLYFVEAETCTRLSQLWPPESTCAKQKRARDRLNFDSLKVPVLNRNVCAIVSTLIPCTLSIQFIKTVCSLSFPRFRKTRWNKRLCLHFITTDNLFSSLPGVKYS